MDFALPEIDTRELSTAGVVVPLTKLDGTTPLLNAKKEPVTLTLLGGDSPQYKRRDRELSRVRIERLQKKRGEATSDEMLDLILREDTETLALMTIGWSGILDSKGKPVEFSHENVIDLYTKFPVAQEQANRAIGDRNRFIQPSSEG